MKRVIGIILPAGEPTFSAIPLLGKPCRAHVEQALTDAGIAAAAVSPGDAQDLRALLAGDVESILLAREDAPCLNADTFRALASAAVKRPAAVLLADMATPLAMAVPAGVLTGLPFQGVPSLSALTDALNEHGEAVKVVHTQSPEAYVAVTDAGSFAAAYRHLRETIVRRHMQNGVIVLDPERTVIEADVRIGEGTVLYAGNTLQGGSVIGTGCTLYPNNRMESAVLGNDVTVES